MNETRFDRQIRLFGVDGQECLERTRVAIIGLGGLGSHVAQQLAFLGIGGLYLVDSDIVTGTSLNRLIGASADDVIAGSAKVNVAERLVKSISPNTAVKGINDSFISEPGFEALASADYVVGCVDLDSARLILNEFCQAYSRPYMDVATDIGTDNELWFGGRTFFSKGGEQCVVCRDVLDQREIRRGFASEAEREEEARIYGVPMQALGETGPAVVSVNGTLASIAVTELMCDITGLRGAMTMLEYRGMAGAVRVDNTQLFDDCYYCKGIYGIGDKADLRRYLTK